MRDEHRTTSPPHTRAHASHAITVMWSSSWGLTRFPVMSANQLPVRLPVTAAGRRTSPRSTSGALLKLHFLDSPPPTAVPYSRAG